MLPNQLANSLQLLCYEHHTAMSVVQMVLGNGSAPQEIQYACQGSDCSARYTREHGYFIAPRNGSGPEKEILPQVRCPHDGALMYLAEVRPQERSLRLWRCPLCSAARANTEVTAA